ncbi:hypothetical protein SAMN02745157_2898 [Kaistia soli DSM 19436]|uniref:Urease accessory protein UreH-like transmembrane domain-containing protein n=1 Tax=Kaistia soli DSM 19436 TaxID=1122133 RepID=A0A1M5E5T1_9HYPH|nr:sulfite exporter TauE/SafE family protein [Kaistia soli]SHF74504.1 hypothetical protein SAMN02745157_2898 [Kaistia soli DSM 19436]
MLLGILLTGLAMGFASSLHCAGMCGPIACGLLLAGGGRSTLLAATLQTLAAQAGRIASYVAAGAAFGVFGAGLYGSVNLQSAHQLMQWAAGLTIVWMGLSVAGVVPAMAGLDRLFLPLAGRLGAFRGSLALAGYPQLLASGVLWGAMPCAMVYAALLNSLLTGSVAGGVTLMAGFGLGTVPAVTLSALGLSRLRKVTATPLRRVLAGGGLISAGVLAIVLTAPGGPLCLS